MTEVQERRGREGGRWINERPSSEEFATWFKDSMKIDKELAIENYIGGVVLIPAVDTKAKLVTGFQNGVPIIEERPELSYVPYAKVETRIDYFWDLMDARDDRVGIVERITPSRLAIAPQLIKQTGEHEREYRMPSALTQMAYQLPDGFSLLTVPVGERYSHFLCCTTKVSIYRADESGELKGPPLREGIGTKQVPLLLGRNNPFADPSSIMKAETGSFGRALGFAGIFVIPGSGVATAEDMLEDAQDSAGAAQQAPAEGQGPAAPTEPPARTTAEVKADEEEGLRAEMLALYGVLKEQGDEKKVERFQGFVRERGINKLSDAKGSTLRGVVRKLEKLLDEKEESADGESSGSSS